MPGPAPPPPRSLRVFEIGDIEIDLPIALARRHESMVVGFSDFGKELGWHARIVGDDGEVVLNFPWHDHAERALAGVRRPQLTETYPTTLTDEGWDDLDQGWWGRVIPCGADVYIAETDFDEILEVIPSRVVPGPSGYVFVDGVLITWNRVSRTRYDQAWQAAIESCRGGRPSPVGDRSEVSIRDPDTGKVSLASRFSFSRAANPHGSSCAREDSNLRPAD